MSKTIWLKLLEIISEELKVDKDKIVLEANFKYDLGADDLDVLELVMKAEEKFDITTVPDEDVEKIITVADLIGLVEDKLERKERAA